MLNKKILFFLPTIIFITTNALESTQANSFEINGILKISPECIRELNNKKQINPVKPNTPAIANDSQSNYYLLNPEPAKIESYEMSYGKRIAHQMMGQIIHQQTILCLYDAFSKRPDYVIIPFFTKLQ